MAAVLARIVARHVIVPRTRTVTMSTALVQEYVKKGGREIHVV